MSDGQGQILQALRAILSQNPALVADGEQKLREWETQPNFFETLAYMSMVTLKDANSATNVQERLLAAVFLKNGIERYWRNSANVSIKVDEKQKIREILLSNFAQEDNMPVVKQIAIVIARIARLDFPRDWPNLIESLMKMIEMHAQQPLRKRCVLLVLHFVIRDLNSARIMSQRRAFISLAVELLPKVLQEWNTSTDNFFKLLEMRASNEAVLMELTNAHISLRTLRKLCNSGGKMQADDALKFHALLQCLFLRLKQCISARAELLQHEAYESLTDLLSRFVLKMIKTLNGYQEYYPENFEKFEGNALELSFYYVFHEGAILLHTAGQLNFPEFVTHAVNLMKNIALRMYFTTANDNANEQPTIQQRFFSAERLHFIMDQLIGHYFLLTREELQEWQENPEEFSQQQECGSAWRFNLRPQMESLYATLFIKYKSIMVAQIKEHLKSVIGTRVQATADFGAILQKEAIYYAIGNIAFHLYDEVDFIDWLRDDLSVEFKNSTPDFAILRRRILLLIAEFAEVAIPETKRTIPYQICEQALRADENVVVRLAACRALKKLIDSFEFLAEWFLPHFPNIFEALFRLLHSAEKSETKITVLSVMSLIVDRLKDHIHAQTEQLAEYLPRLWQESSQHPLLRGAIVRTLDNIVKHMNGIHDALKQFLYACINYSTNYRTNTESVYLIDDGLQLWATVVENSKSLDDELKAMAANLPGIATALDDNVRVVLIIIQRYIMLDAPSYLSAYGSTIFNVVDISTVVGDVALLALANMNWSLRLAPQQTLRLLHLNLPFIFQEVFKEKMPALRNSYTSIISRVLLIDDMTFIEIYNSLQLPNAFESFLSSWLDQLNMLHAKDECKLCCLALIKTIGNNELILNRFPQIMDAILYTLDRVMEKEGDDDGYVEGNNDMSKNYHCIDSFVIQNDSGNSDGGDNDDDNTNLSHELSMRLQRLDGIRSANMNQKIKTDPVYAVVITELVYEQLYKLRSSMQPDQYAQLMASVNPSTIERINDYIQRSAFTFKNLNGPIYSLIEH